MTLRARITSAAIVFGLCGLLVGPAFAADPRLERGRQAYMTHCAVCHGADATGGGPMEPELRTPAPDLTHIAARRGGTYPAVEIREIIDGRRAIRAHGPSGMPIWGRKFGTQSQGGGPAEVVARDQLQLLVDYLASIQSDEKKAEEKK
ncbi:MAG: cytochrome c [Deltaproteobacteria bacterium]|nr:cytochrome c [Deltaproteobacteria bacterium]MBW2414729.1 cytochrome c [Deltaproteobacteria bacterium]